MKIVTNFYCKQVGGFLEQLMNYLTISTNLCGSRVCLSTCLSVTYHKGLNRWMIVFKFDMEDFYYFHLEIPNLVKLLSDS
jgi:hypothetical protein